MADIHPCLLALSLLSADDVPFYWWLNRIFPEKMMVMSRLLAYVGHTLWETNLGIQNQMGNASRTLSMADANHATKS